MMVINPKSFVSCYTMKSFLLEGSHGYFTIMHLVAEESCITYLLHHCYKILDKNQDEEGRKDNLAYNLGE